MTPYKARYSGILARGVRGARRKHAVPLASFKESEEVGVNDTHRAIGISLVHHARDVDLARSCSRSAPHELAILMIERKSREGSHTLRDHFNVDIMLSQHTKHSPGNTHHVLHLLAHQTHNGHLIDQFHRS